MQASLGLRGTLCVQVQGGDLFFFWSSFFEILKLLDIPSRWLVKTIFFEDYYFQRRYYACAAFHRRPILTRCTTVYTLLQPTSVNKNNTSQNAAVQNGESCWLVIPALEFL